MQGVAFVRTLSFFTPSMNTNKLSRSPVIDLSRAQTFFIENVMFLIVQFILILYFVSNYLKVNSILVPINTNHNNSGRWL